MTSTLIRRATRACALVLALVAVILLGNARLGHRDPSGSVILGVNASTTEAQAKKDFLISGHANGLYPGATRSLVLTVKNPFPQNLKVTAIHITVIETDHVGCPTSDLTVTDFAGALIVPPRGSATTTVSVSMSSNAANACQGARFHLKYLGRGEQA